MRPESSGVLSQAWHWVRPPQRPFRPAPLPSRVWPLWLRLPWSSAAQPRAARRSTLPLASPALLDRSSTTVSSASRVLSPPSPRWLSRHGNPSCLTQAEVEGVSLSLQIPWCVRAVLPLGSVCFLEPACHATKVFISPYLDNNNVGPVTVATTQSTHTVSTTAGVSYHFVCFTRVIVLPVLLGVLCATPARLVPSTTILEQTVAQVARQVCLVKLFQSGFIHIISKSVETCLICCPQVSIHPIRAPLHVHRVHWELSASKLAPAWIAQGCLVSAGCPPSRAAAAVRVDSDCYLD